MLRVFALPSYHALPSPRRKFDRAVRRFASNFFRALRSRAPLQAAPLLLGPRFRCPVRESRTVLIRSHQLSHAFAEAASSLSSSIARFVSRIDSNRNPSAAEMFRSSSSASSNFCVGRWALDVGRWTFSCELPATVRAIHQSELTTLAPLSFPPR